MYTPFLHNAVVILDATRDETGILPVDPATYYGDRWTAAQVAAPATVFWCAECSEAIAPALAVWCDDEVLHPACARGLVTDYTPLPGTRLQGARVPAFPQALQLAQQAVIAAAIALADSHTPDAPAPVPQLQALVNATRCYQQLSRQPSADGRYHSYI